MKVENITNQIATKNFIKAIVEIIAENTSHNYSIFAMNSIKDKLGMEFKFSKNVYITGKLIEVDKAINAVSGKELNKFFTKIVDFVGPNYLKLLLVQKLNPTDVEYLENIGLKFG